MKVIEKSLNIIKKYWYIFAIIIAVIAILLLVVSLMNNNKAKQVENIIDGKLFMYSDFVYKDYTAYSFNDGKIAIEKGESYLHNNNQDGYVDGNINEHTKEYKISASIFSDMIWIKTKESYGWSKEVAVTLEDGVVKKYKHTDSTPEWKQVSAEELDVFRADCICNHQFSEWEILKTATVDEKGNRKHICSKCNNEETKEFTYASMFRPTISMLEERILNTYDREFSEWTMSESGGLKTYVMNFGIGKHILSVPVKETELALVFNRKCGSESMIFSTSKSSNGHIEWTCMQANYNLNSLVWEEILKLNFGNENPFPISNVGALYDNGKIYQEKGASICEYEYGGIKIKVKEQDNGFYFFTYF